MTKRPDDHALAVEEGKISPAIVLFTVIMILLFVVAGVYRLGITVV